MNDTFRIRFYDGYITQVTRAKSEGSDVRGYFAWSMMDNFEWADGYSKRFGLHYVNYSNNLTRHAKQSAYWFSNYINTLNPNATYIGPTLQQTPMPSGYAVEVCPTPSPTAKPDEDKNTTADEVGIVFLIVIVLMGVLVLAFVALRCIKGREKMRLSVNYQNGLLNGHGVVQNLDS